MAPQVKPTLKFNAEAARRRKVRYVRFSHPTYVPGVGRVLELNADSEAILDYPGNKASKVPDMWYVYDEHCLLIGSMRYHPANPVIEGWDVGE